MPFSILRKGVVVHRACPIGSRWSHAKHATVLGNLPKVLALYNSPLQPRLRLCQRPPGLSSGLRFCSMVQSPYVPSTTISPTALGPPKPWSTTVHWLLLLACSASFLIQTRLTVGRALPHQLAMKKMPHSPSHRPI